LGQSRLLIGFLHGFPLFRTLACSNWQSFDRIVNARTAAAGTAQRASTPGDLDRQPEWLCNRRGLSGGQQMKVGSTIMLAMSFSIGPQMAAIAETKSAAFEGGYIMAAYFTCPVTATYSSMNKFFKYQGTKDYDRGYAAFKAALKGPRPSKVCFDA